MKHGFDPWIRKIPWRRKWQSALVCLPEKIPWTEEPGLGAGYIPWGVGQDLSTKQKQANKNMSLLILTHNIKHFVIVLMIIPNTLRDVVM